MFCSDTTKKIKILVLTALMVFVWLILGMVYTERFVLPFGRLKVQLMPWTEQVSPDASLDQRLSLIEKQIDSSNMVAQYALMTMIVSFAALTIYLSVVYQQKQRRASEHLVLYLKNQEIWRRNEFIRYISATIGHEFKNNLGRIKRRIDMIHGLPQDVKKRIDDNMEKLFADIEIFKKISDEREASLIEFMKIDFKDMLNDLAVQYGDLADFKIREGAVLPMIYAAPPMLKTVFENVIDNAVKYKKT